MADDLHSVLSTPPADPTSEIRTPEARRAPANGPRPGAADGTAVSEEIGDREAAVAELERFLAESKLKPQLTVDGRTGDVVVKIVKQETGELVRQIPPDEILQLRKRIRELAGILLDQRI